MNDDPQNELDAQAPAPQPRPQVIPTCGNCGAGRVAPWDQGAPIVMTNTAMGPMLLGVFHCGNPECGAIHSIQVLEIASRAPDQQKPLIHTGSTN